MPSCEQAPEEKNPGFAQVEPYLFILPFVALMAAFNLYVYISGIRLAFTDAQGINPGEWIGLANFAELIADKQDFWPAIGRTFLYTFGCLITQDPGRPGPGGHLEQQNLRTVAGIPAGLFLCPGPNEYGRGRPALPHDVPAGYRDGQLVSGGFGCNGEDQLALRAQLSLLLMIIVSFWQWTGYHMVYFLASLQSINPTHLRGG